MIHYLQRLDQLPKEISQTFHSDFLFLIYPDKIQHFPARGWTEEQKITEFAQRFGRKPQIVEWRGHQVVYIPESNWFGLIP